VWGRALRYSGGGGRQWVGPEGRDTGGRGGSHEPVEEEKRRGGADHHGRRNTSEEGEEVAQ
jgi:hypothetical protein